MNAFIKYSLFIVVALASAAAGFYFSQNQSPTPSSTQKTTTKVTFSLPDLEGKIHHSDEWANKIQVINFWATWCPPCRKEIPGFVELQSEFKTHGVQFIGIATADSKDKVEAFLNQVPVNYPMLMGEQKGITLSKQLGNKMGGLPFTIIVDRDGKIQKRISGELSKKEATSILKQLF